MVSSTKNRFVNSYEPIFVFSKTYNNYYSNYKNNRNYTNILKINLQPSPYKHVAVYPLNLIIKLLYLLNLNKNSTILLLEAGRR
jgi:hypothetical protein